MRLFRRLITHTKDMVSDSNEPAYVCVLMTCAKDVVSIGNDNGCCHSP